MGAFELSMNRAAEKAVPQVAQIFGDAIRRMSLRDARGILAGGDHAATDYFRGVAGDALDGLFTTIGEQEQSIRHHPGARRTELLKRVFGGH